MNCLQSWPEPVVRVQSLSDSGIRVIPERYVKRPSRIPFPLTPPAREVDIPVINLQNLLSNDNIALCPTILTTISNACREWGFFQVVNHGISQHLMVRSRQVWREFFHLPAKEKQVYANSPTTYEGYGSRLGVEKGAKLDWSDYFFLNYLPVSLRDQNKWPVFPECCRELVGEYNEAIVKLCGQLIKILSISLGLGENCLQQALGGEEIGGSLRANFYPKCPQPDLTFGLSPHSDPGAITILLPDDQVSGLQVRKEDNWVTVKPVPNAFIVNIGDQIELKSEILNSDGIKALISADEAFLLELALKEMLDELNCVAGVVSRFGKKCSIPALQGFEHVYGDIVGGVIEVRELGFLVKDMEAMVRKMERYVNSTTNLYVEMEVLSELEQPTKKFQLNQHYESRRAFEQKLVWQKQDVRHLKDVSLLNQTYDKVMELLARTIYTLYVRLCHVFGKPVLRREFNLYRFTFSFV